MRSWLSPRRGLVVALLALAATLVIALSSGAASKMPVSFTPDQLQWKDMPNSNGIQAAVLWGNMEKGNYGAFVKFPAGLSNPLHTHSADLKVVVVSGTLLYTPDGQETRHLGPGSFVLVPGGSRHTSGADPASEVVLFQEQTAKFDMKPVMESTAAHH